MGLGIGVHDRRFHICGNAVSEPIVIRDKKQISENARIVYVDKTPHTTKNQNKHNTMQKNHGYSMKFHEIHT